MNALQSEALDSRLSTLYQHYMDNATLFMQQLLNSFQQDASNVCASTVQAPQWGVPSWNDGKVEIGSRNVCCIEKSFAMGLQEDVLHPPTCVGFAVAPSFAGSPWMSDEAIIGSGLLSISSRAWMLLHQVLDDAVTCEAILQQSSDDYASVQNAYAFWTLAKSSGLCCTIASQVTASSNT